MTCAVDGCGRPADGARGWCRKHYARWARHGDPTATRQYRPQIQPPEDPDAVRWVLCGDCGDLLGLTRRPGTVGRLIDEHVCQPVRRRVRS